MSDDILIPYDSIIEKCLRNVVREIILEIEKNGLPGDHHFYITFLTKHPKAEIPSYLREEYPEEMTIVLQHQYSNLKVHKDHFDVFLIFKSHPERVSVPFDAIVDFADPHARFRLEFDQVEIEEDEEFDGTDPDDTPPQNLGEKVVSLDTFRKKK